MIRKGLEDHQEVCFDPFGFSVIENDESGMLSSLLLGRLVNGSLHLRSGFIDPQQVRNWPWLFRNEQKVNYTDLTKNHT